MHAEHVTGARVGSAATNDWRATRAVTGARWLVVAVGVSLVWAAEVRLLHVVQGRPHGWLETWGWTAAAVGTWGALAAPIVWLTHRVRHRPARRAAVAHTLGVAGAILGYVAIRAAVDMALPAIARTDARMGALLTWYAIRSAGPVALAYAATAAAALAWPAFAGSRRRPAATTLAPGASAASTPAADPPSGASPRPATVLTVPVGGRTLGVPLDAVLWIEAAGNYVYLHLSGGRAHLVREPLKAVEARLDPAAFRRVHRSAIVGVAHVREARPAAHGAWRLLLDGGAEVPVSRRSGVDVSALVRAGRVVNGRD